MRVGIIQPNYLPWRGYFDFINQVDLFILLDDVQYTERDWRNRNLIRSSQGLQWISVPVIHTSRSQLINETRIDYSQKWADKQLQTLKHSYGKTLYFDKYIDKLRAILNTEYPSISTLDTELIAWVCSELDITTPLVHSSELHVSGSKTDRLINILKQVGGTAYLSGPAAKDYLDVDMFRKEKIALEYKTYSYKEYPQLHSGFVGNVSIIDLLFNCGINSGEYLKCELPNDVVYDC